jgi:hypothetical protein
VNAVPPSSSSIPDEVSDGIGEIAFAIPSAEAAGRIDLLFEVGQAINTWYHFGPTLENPVPHWFEFLFDGRTGAQLFDADRDGLVEQVRLHLIDGERGDTDLAADGTLGVQSLAAASATAPPPGGQPLRIRGTARSDQIVVSWDEAAAEIVAYRNGQLLGRFAAGPIREVIVSALAGNDRVIVDPQFPLPIRVYGGPGDDALTGGAADDVLIGGPGNDRLDGRSGNDRLLGGPGNDRLFGDEGDDVLIGGRGNDRIVGGAGNDRGYGGPGSDTLLGGPGDDLLRGSAGNDVLFGGPGNDRLFGDAGRDRLFGGIGIDQLTGGPGRDVRSDPDAGVPAVPVATSAALPATALADPFDVNDDGSVTPLDLLLIINQLNAASTARPPGGSTGDVNRDGLLTPLDALRMVNRLNRVGDDVQADGELANEDQPFPVDPIGDLLEDVLDTLARDAAGKIV